MFLGTEIVNVADSTSTIVSSDQPDGKFCGKFLK